MSAVTQKELELVAYGDFKSKYEELGISESFISGKKKVWYISNALDILKVKSGLVDSEDEESLSQTKEAILIVKDNAEKLTQTIADKKELALNEAVEKVISKKEFWNEIAMAKRIRQHENVFLQHRGTEKGNNAIFQKEVLIKAFDKLYKD